MGSMLCRNCGGYRPGFCLSCGSLSIVRNYDADVSEENYDKCLKCKFVSWCTCLMIINGSPNELTPEEEFEIATHPVHSLIDPYTGDDIRVLSDEEIIACIANDVDLDEPALVREFLFAYEAHMAAKRGRR